MIKPTHRHTGQTTPLFNLSKRELKNGVFVFHFYHYVHQKVSTTGGHENCGAGPLENAAHSLGETNTLFVSNSVWRTSFISKGFLDEQQEEKPLPPAGGIHLRVEYLHPNYVQIYISI